MERSFRYYAFAHHKDVFQVIDKIMESHGYTYYLIGANARDVQLYKAGKRPMRNTEDVDFAVMLPDKAAYDKLLANFLNYGFEPTLLKYRLCYRKTNTVVDILPFGQIAQNYTINFDQRHVELSVLGFSEVAEAIEYFEYPKGYSISCFSGSWTHYIETDSLGE